MGRYLSKEPVWLPRAPRIRALEGDEQLIKDWQPLRMMRLRVEEKGKRIALRDEESGRYMTELSIESTALRRLSKSARYFERRGAG